ncbi:MAG TPA: (d)CMP kinase [Candidatus Limiplasma sp.]|nr:(d)CMP kinase [Candidatus Limiplasma sp.]HRX09495.1 (d)CMP kinase [Candidatus Limiplasma sp.]
MTDKHITIAIDGPGGAGKSTVADEVAKKLGILHLDTGAMYRAFAFQALSEGIDPSDEAALTELVGRTQIDVELLENGVQRTLVNGVDVTDKIRTPEISFAASTSSKCGAVRRFMVQKQQALAKTRSMILDGRDIGTKVLTDATLKVFLTATPQERAKRRYEQMLAAGQPADYQQVLSDVIARDHQDSTRKIDPLRPAEDAVIVDNTDFVQAQTVAAILKLLEDRL